MQMIAAFKPFRLCFQRPRSRRSRARLTPGYRIRLSQLAAVTSRSWWGPATGRRRITPPTDRLRVDRLVFLTRVVVVPAAAADRPGRWGGRPATTPGRSWLGRPPGCAPRRCCLVEVSVPQGEAAGEDEDDEEEEEDDEDEDVEDEDCSSVEPRPEEELYCGCSSSS